MLVLICMKRNNNDCIYISSCVNISVDFVSFYNQTVFILILQQLSGINHIFEIYLKNIHKKPKLIAIAKPVYTAQTQFFSFLTVKAKS